MPWSLTVVRLRESEPTHRPVEISLPGLMLGSDAIHGPSSRSPEPKWRPPRTDPGPRPVSSETETETETETAAYISELINASQRFFADIELVDATG